MLCELGLYGPFYEIHELLFYKRYHPRNYYNDLRARMVWFDAALKGKLVFPYWMQFFDYLQTIRRVPISGREKLGCLAYMFRWLLEHGGNLAGDLIVAAYAVLHPGSNTYDWRSKNKDIYN